MRNPPATAVCTCDPVHPLVHPNQAHNLAGWWSSNPSPNANPNPNPNQAHLLAGWWSTEGQQQSLRALSVAGAGGGGAGKPSPRIVFSDVEVS